VRCDLLAGARDALNGRAVDYRCEDGTVVLRDLDRSASAWKATMARLTGAGDGALPPAAITSARYGQGRWVTAPPAQGAHWGAIRPATGRPCDAAAD
jgi:hypothetical protein